MVKVKRVYEPYESGDGTRFLVERLWPRGMKKESLHMEAWLKDAAPVIRSVAGSDTTRKNGVSSRTSILPNWIPGGRPCGP